MTISDSSFDRFSEVHPLLSSKKPASEKSGQKRAPSKPSKGGKGQSGSKGESRSKGGKGGGVDYYKENDS